MTTNGVHHVAEVRNWKDLLNENEPMPEGPESLENGTHRDETLHDERVPGCGDEHGGGLEFLDGMERAKCDPFLLLDLGYCPAFCQSSDYSIDDSPTLQPISILERLICTNPIWFLSDIQRSGAVHLLQGKDVGNFIIRNSSKLGTMALTVRLPESAGPYIEHYLIEKTDSGQALEGSDTHFSSIPVLVTYYSQCCDELPVQLTLPPPIMEAKSRQELLSLALLGQDFWVTPICRNSYIEQNDTTNDQNKENTEVLLEPVQQLITSRTEQFDVPSSETESECEMPDVIKKNFTDSPGLFYHSSLADKISDYEDIWGCSVIEHNTKTFSTFKPQRRHLERNVKKLSVQTQVSVDRTMVTHWTQTEEKPQFSRQCSASVQDIRSHLSSPFYSEPIDSVLKSVGHRHSDPNILWGSKKMMERLRSKSLLVGKSVSSSLNNVSADDDNADCLESSSPRRTAKRTPDIWAVDSSWEWLGRDEDNSGGGKNGEGKFPVDLIPEDGDVTTVEDLILFDTPELGVQHRSSVAEYDNLGVNKGRQEEEKKCADGIDDTATEFSEPWDSLRWEHVLQLIIPAGGDSSSAKGDEGDFGSLQSFKPRADRLSFDTIDDTLSITSESTLVSEASTTHMDYSMLGSPKMLTMRSEENAGANIQKYIYRLAEERDNTFGKAIENFIQCTKESTETNPAVIVRNIRQFMNGMKNYLLKHGEGQFEQLVQQERNRLKADKFLNIDATIEEAMHRLVIKPLKKFLYQLFINAFKRNGSLQLISDNIKTVRNKSPREMGVKPEFQPPEGPALEMVKYFFAQLQQAYSPLKKLENLLAAISTIYNCVQDQKVSQDKVHASLGADDFLPIFIYVLVQCGLIAAEIEAEYMWGLLHPSLLSGEGGYYLTTLSSAVHVLKNWHETSDSAKRELHIVSGEPRLPKIGDLQGFMKVMIPDETSGSIVSKTLPVRPNMTTKDVCKMIAHKFKITNPQDYGLFKLVKGEETQLGDNESPQSIKGDLLTSETECLFAYKRCDTKFIWPVSYT